MKTEPAYLEFEGVALHFDVVESENQKHTATATEHVVESGANVSDHVRDDLATVTLSVFVSNTPFVDVNRMWDGRVAGLELKVPEVKTSLSPMPGALMNAGLDALTKAIRGPKSWKAETMQWPSEFDNVGFVFNSLLDWKSRGVVGKVITPHRSYESMYITGVDMTRDAETGEGASINIELKEIRLVEALLVTAPVPTEERGKVSKPKGRQMLTFTRGEPSPEQEESVARALKVRLLKGLVGG